MQLFNDAAGNTRGKVLGIYSLLLVFNGAAWLWAIVALRHFPVLLGTAFLAYSFGLRHAVDADHIAAIDNVTRKLIQDGRRPITVGFFFALGHSTIVLIAACLIAFTVGALAHFEDFSRVGSVIATATSAAFLFAIAAMNAAGDAPAVQRRQKSQSGDHHHEYRYQHHEQAIEETSEPEG